MPSPSSLRQLDKSSPDFFRQLDDVLQGEEHKQCVPDLKKDDLMWLVDFLDETVEDSNIPDPTRGRCLSELSRTCGIRRVLPSSYGLSSRRLEINSDAFATGGYGDVYEATLDGADVRVKRVRIPHQKYLATAEKSFCEGAVVWMHLNHQHIAPLLGATLFPLQLISNWMPNGSLPEYIKNHPEANLIDLLCGVAKGIQYLHSCDVVHREIKGSNILVDAAGHAQIVDIGLALVTTREHFAVGPYQTEYSPRWTAPEVLSRKESSKAADIFSFGMLMAEVFTGAIPLEDLPGFRAGLAIIEGTRPSRPMHPVVTDELWELMQQCWNPNPQSRPDAEHVLRILEEYVSAEDSPSPSHVSPGTTLRESSTSSVGSPRPDRSPLEGSLPFNSASPGGYRRVCVII